jgi:hypothetical protein
MLFLQEERVDLSPPHQPPTGRDPLGGCRRRRGGTVARMPHFGSKIIPMLAATVAALFCDALLHGRYSQRQTSLIVRFSTRQRRRMLARITTYHHFLGFDAWACSMLFGGFVVAGSLLLLLM